ncbi:hypothetical protein [Desulfoferrobacter suflitae]|uniref:hypothetical protein n=1 Tax=Desulfoferrobacter suflitae TaxID=2865782 RepID=UPI0021647A09|nr:hypothetical protein [Desulfoferrobacter suflitae]MCK8602882.1 hypothetical protein [Desulfoferrobacter suflitae]
MFTRVIRLLVVALAIVSLAAPATFAGGPIKGEIIAIEGGTYTVKDYDGKEYQISEELVTGLDLETGDVVQFELEEAEPVNIQEVDE